VAALRGIPTDELGWIKAGCELIKWRKMPSSYLNNQQELFPVLSNTLKPLLGIGFDRPDFSNRYVSVPPSTYCLGLS